MLCSLKYCVRLATRSQPIVKFRSFSQLTEENQSKFGRNGHYDIIIVGGGATGISLAGAIGMIIQYTQTFKIHIHFLYL